MNKLRTISPELQKRQQTDTLDERVGKTDNQQNIPELSSIPMQDG
jgi:hypothetical protein